MLWGSERYIHGRKCLFDKLDLVLQEKHQVVCLQVGELDLVNRLGCKELVSNWLLKIPYASVFNSIWSTMDRSKVEVFS